MVCQVVFANFPHTRLCCFISNLVYTGHGFDVMASYLLLYPHGVWSQLDTLCELCNLPLGIKEDPGEFISTLRAKTLALGGISVDKI